LLVALRREDIVLPGDLALRKAIRDTYHLGPSTKSRGGPRNRREVASVPESGHVLPVCDGAGVRPIQSMRVPRSTEPNSLVSCSLTSIASWSKLSSGDDQGCAAFSGGRNALAGDHAPGQDAPTGPRLRPDPRRGFER
jgi:hypothetical protein